GPYRGEVAIAGSNRSAEGFHGLVDHLLALGGNQPGARFRGYAAEHGVVLGGWSRVAVFRMSRAACRQWSASAFSPIASCASLMLRLIYVLLRLHLLKQPLEIFPLAQRIQVRIGPEQVDVPVPGSEGTLESLQGLVS